MAKIKDLTPEEIDKICDKYDRCKDCPLCFYKEEYTYYITYICDIIRDLKYVGFDILEKEIEVEE